jgi:hypothetical protein
MLFYILLIFSLSAIFQLYHGYQLLARGRWFSPASSTTKTGSHDIAEILLKVALIT